MTKGRIGAGFAVLLVIVLAVGLTRDTNKGTEDNGVDQAIVQTVTSVTVEVPKEAGCEALPAPGTSAQCDIIETGLDDAAYVVERDQGSGDTTVRVFRRASPTSWELLLRAEPEATLGYDHIEARSGDMNGDEIAEVVVVYRERVDGGRLALDVIDVTAGEVTTHHEQKGGVVRFDKGVLETWEDLDEKDGVVTSWRHAVIKLDGRSIRVTAEPTDERPPADTF